MSRIRLPQVFVALALIAAWAFLAEGRAQAQPAGTIQVTFTNATNQHVTFFLNGGTGLETRLDPGQSLSYTMVVDAGIQPTVKIYQPVGGSRTFTVANGGQYAFRYKGNQIYNFFN